MRADDVDAVTTAAASMLSLLDAHETVAETLHRLVVTVTASVPGADAASITLLHERAPATVAQTAERALVIDEWEYATGRGPCIDALRTAEDQYTASPAAAEARWPGIGEVLRDAGVGSALGLPLSAAGAVVGAVNVYADAEHAFDERSRRLAGVLTTQLAVTAHNIRVLDASRALAGHLRTALESRAVIEQAKGVLMAQRGYDEQRAFDVLRTASQRENVKLREVADRIVRAVGQRDVDQRDAAEVRTGEDAAR
jgi:transcriptional regulator with GAF, ATPase, and Fis domain